MEMSRYVEALEADVAAVAAVGDEQTRLAAERVLHAIRGSVGLRLLDALGEAALELSTQLPSGHSSPVLTQNRIFLTAYDNNKLFVICLDRACLFFGEFV